MTCTHDLTERVAIAIYHAAFENRTGGQPEPGWCWLRAGEVQREFCRKQARAAIAAMNFNPDEPIEDLSAHYAHAHKLKIASP